MLIGKYGIFSGLIAFRIFIIFKKLENVCVKHYAHKHMLSPKDNSCKEP